MLGSLLLPFVALASAATAAWTPSPSGTSQIVPDAYIIQVDEVALSKRGILAGDRVRNVLAQVDTAGILYTVRQQIQGGSRFQGASIKVAHGVTANDLLKVSGVNRVWPVRRHRRPTTSTSWDGAASSTGGGPTSAEELVADFIAPISTDSIVSPLVSRAMTKRQSSSFNYTTDTFGPHVMTGVNNTHAAGVLGSGMLVCMLDSGIDYLNPILGGCFGPRCHVSVGYDFVGDAYDGDNDPVASPDPYSTCDPHGTHVSGIVGALANKYGFSGVAPQASIGMFRVLGCGGDTDDDIVLQAFVMAMQSGCNIINMSLAGPAGWLSNTPTELMVEVAAEQGIFTVACVGNEGAEGLFYAEQPASSLAGVGAASIAVQEVPAFNATLLGHDPVSYMSATPFNATNLSPGYRLYFTSLNVSTPNDACSPLPSGTPDLGNYVVVVQRGTCTFTTKWANIVAAGGRYVLLYNYASETQQLYLDKGTSGLYALATMRHADGVTLLNRFIAERARLVIKFPAGPLVPGVVDNLEGGLISSTSNYGPTLDLFGGPSLSAPGVNIISTYPLKNGGLGVLSGTSMASPFIAGAAALIMSTRASEGLSVAQVKGLIATTSRIITEGRGSGPYVTAPLQGAGLIQVDVALAAKTFVSPSVLLLNDTTYFNGVQTITITNKNAYTTFYTVVSRSASGKGLYASSNTILPALSPPTVSAAQAGVSFSRGRMTIQSGQTVTLTATFTPPSLSASDAALYPIYSGWILINGGPVGGGPAQETYTVPYFGLSGSLFNVPILDTSPTINGVGYTYPFIATPDDIQLLPTTYTFPVGPLILTRFAMGSPYTSIDLVPGNITFLGTILSDNNGASSRARRHLDFSPPSPNRMKKTRQARALFSDTVTIGNIYNAGYQPRSARVTSDTVDQENQFSGTYTDINGVVQTVERAVSYRILVRSCKITGDAKYEDQYESWLSPSFLYSP